MFILRKITGRDNLEFNFSLGESYTLITKFRNEAQFKEVWETNFKGAFDYDEIYAFITTSKETHCCFVKQQNYIMTENGKTFTHITQ